MAKNWCLSVIHVIDGGLILIFDFLLLVVSTDLNLNFGTVIGSTHI